MSIRRNVFSSRFFYGVLALLPFTLSKRHAGRTVRLFFF